ncbi:hypothetical protein MMC16_005877 [Acarospora aff. strigata]|nr:hypothetical protein [Acarospora aff. strigata]
MSTPQPEHAAAVQRKRQASVAFSRSASPSLSRSSKVAENDAPAGLDSPASRVSPSKSEGLDPEELASQGSGSEVMDSDDCEYQELDFDGPDDEEPDYDEEESAWPESDGNDSETEKPHQLDPTENATMSALTFRTKVLAEGAFREFEWLENIIGKVTYKENTPNAKVIGHGSARLIRRNHIRRSFHQDMEEPSQDTSELGFNLFDRYGHLKGELIEHCVKKGTGVWGNEVDEGNILSVEMIMVDKEWRRKGVGAQLAKKIWRKARKSDSHLRFAFAWATQINSEVRNKLEGKSKADRDALFDEKEAIAVSLFRSLGYRRVGSTVWFCFAADPEHASHRIAPADDFDPPQHPSNDLDSDDNDIFDDIEARSLEKLQQNRPLHHAITAQADNDCVEYLNQRRIIAPVTDAAWEAVDRSGNTILHLAANNSKTKTLHWIMDSGLDTKLINVRNYEGYTPLEALESTLDSTRIKKELQGAHLIWPASDDFRGFGEESVLCLLRLRGKRNPSMKEIARIKCGCTCGECIQGFLSPRMLHALLFRAEISHDMLDENTYDTDPEMWLWMNDHYTVHMHPSVHDNLRTNKSMRQGFSNMFDHIAQCLRAKQVPNEITVLSRILDNSEWPPHTKNFLQRGGKVSDALSVVIDHAMDADEKIGTGEFLECMRDEVEQLTKCRNDHEYGFVRYFCGLQQPSRFVPMERVGVEHLTINHLRRGRAVQLHMPGNL